MVVAGFQPAAEPGSQPGGGSGQWSASGSGAGARVQSSRVTKMAPPTPAKPEPQASGGSCDALRRSVCEAPVGNRPNRWPGVTGFCPPEKAPPSGCLLRGRPPPPRTDPPARGARAPPGKLGIEACSEPLILPASGLSLRGSPLNSINSTLDLGGSLPNPEDPPVNPEASPLTRRMSGENWSHLGAKAPKSGREQSLLNAEPRRFTFEPGKPRRCRAESFTRRINRGAPAQGMPASPQFFTPGRSPRRGAPISSLQ